LTKICDKDSPHEDVLLSLCWLPDDATENKTTYGLNKSLFKIENTTPHN